MTPRSYLYVPADQPRLLAGAAGRGADALIVDLEDAVAVPHKGSARTAAAGYLDTGTAWVRINADAVAEDLAAVADRPGLAGLVVPKAEPALLSEVDRLLESRDVPVLALLETARGLRDLHAVAGSPRVVRLGLGEADLTGELHLRPGPDRVELWPIRSAVVVASAAAGLLPPVGPVHTEVRDLSALERTTELLLRQGFRARTAITPTQVATINAVFTPSPEEVERARATVALLSGSTGVAVDADGRMVDEAVVRSAREVLARSDRLQEQ
ncbi:HpcH/HpaI aldolase/citrate lyase family protein [Actinophytocola algeriensis]|uniref:Citrate lyase subunit beta/citryl-CoA lyase n=1 Tax=Actinophytocola algeriensis TaxID=1768010 RepID=A0A7W7Q1V2_9PSEU|nr:aldolase/citrate lyase family protein [Actinophytocola algeriensis]MBB4905254.1 citrate lyase subunit beta/citryl-CoA lyase [Actinophytocola algeriensis]MBE1473061.1 citrate lyase subunit beta/citryl-CoA lyase [Actinophytocola algeriensis]